jgi:hypothetical protein
MSHLMQFCLASSLFLVGSGGAVHAYDRRVDPDVVSRAEMTVTFSPKSMQAPNGSADHIFSAEKPNLPPEYASAMTWYRVALAGGYTQAPMVASPWSRDEKLPEPLHWAWIADNGDLITRVGKGVFRISFADNQSNWFQDVDCRLSTWPGGDTEAPMTCADGKDRKMQIPGDGVIVVDDKQFTRVFDSDDTTLPPEEVIDVDAATAAAVKSLQGDNAPPADAGSAPEQSGSAPAAKPSATLALPNTVPIPPSKGGLY